MPYKKEQQKLNHIVFLDPTKNSILKQASDKPELLVNVAVNKKISPWQNEPKLQYYP